MATDVTKKDEFQESTASQIHDLKQTFLQEISALRNMLKQHGQCVPIFGLWSLQLYRCPLILTQYFRHIYEIKNISTGGLVEFEEDCSEQSMPVTATSLKKSQVHPVVTAKRPTGGTSTTFLRLFLSY